jgi:glycerol-3-phosphate dehydrogenase
LIKSSAELDQGAILRIVRDEMVVHLDDLILRRTLLGYLGRLSPGTLQELSSQVGKILGWNEETRVAELNRTLEILADRHGVRFTS